VADRPESDLRELRDQEIGGDDDHCRDDEVSRAHPPERHELGHLLSRCLGGLGSKLVEADLV
jgi:hypothetical protein